jgi:hypothetical protein
LNAEMLPPAVVNTGLGTHGTTKFSGDRDRVRSKWGREDRTSKSSSTARTTVICPPDGAGHREWQAAPGRGKRRGKDKGPGPPEDAGRGQSRAGDNASVTFEIKCTETKLRFSHDLAHPHKAQERTWKAPVLEHRRDVRDVGRKPGVEAQRLRAAVVAQGWGVRQKR